MDKPVFIFLILFGIFVVIRSIYYENDLSKNKMSTNGKIIDYYKVGQRNYIKYIYRVNRKWYNNEINVYPFKCEDGTEGCVGRKFLVYYSNKNFTNSDMHLGIYEKYKRRTRIINYLD